MKVSIIGSSGKVGLELTRLIAEQNSFINPILVILYSLNNVNKVKGYLQDLEESILMQKKKFANHICFYPTSDIQDIKNSDLIVICAGKFATIQEKIERADEDKTGRDIQSIKNVNMIKNICQDIKNTAENSKVLVVTNQSDVMSAVARTILNGKQVYGLGCYINTLRFKKIFIEELQKKGQLIEIKDIHANILGYHNKYLFIEIENNSYFKYRDVSNIIEQCIQKTIYRGKEISDMQKDIHLPYVNSGASKLPAAALFNIIEAFTQPNKVLDISLNRLLNEEEINNTKLIFHDAAQLMCRVVEGNVKPITTHISSMNIEHLKNGARDLANKLEKMKNITD